MIVPEAAEIQRYSEEILRRPEFNPTMVEPHTPGWLLRALEWLATHRVLPFANVDIGKILLLVVGATLVTLLTIWLVRLIRSGAFIPRHQEKFPGQRASTPGKPTTPHDSLRMASSALAAGDARGAVQALLRACLDHLATMGAITLERWKTNTIYLEECPTSMPSFAIFQELAMAHNDIVYAHRSIEANRMGAMMEALARQIETT